MSSQILITIGTCNTPAAFMVSKKTPSLVLALPMVPQATSLPLSENLALDLTFTFLYIFDAWAKPNNLGICPAVQEISALLFFCLVRSLQLPSSFRLKVVK